MVIEVLLSGIMMILRMILSFVFELGGGVFRVIDLLTRGNFSAVIPYLDAFVDINVLRGSIGTILSVYAVFWSAFVTNWIIKRIRGG